jgi:DNA-binding transcriptional ArsR family regulator
MKKKSRSSRSYIRAEIKAATHPVRAQILKALKASDKSTIELESITGEARYNLYHHLNALEQAGFVGWKMRDNKTKLYQLKNPKNPEATVLVFDKDDIKSNQKRFKALLNVLSEIGGEDIQDIDKITDAEICFYYSRPGKKKGKGD